MLKKMLQLLFLMAESLLGAGSCLVNVTPFSSLGNSTSFQKTSLASSLVAFTPSCLQLFYFLFNLFLPVILPAISYLSQPNLKTSNKHLPFGMPVYIVVTPAAWALAILNPHHSLWPQIIKYLKYFLSANSVPRNVSPGFGWNPVSLIQMDKAGVCLCDGCLELLSFSDLWTEIGEGNMLSAIGVLWVWYRGL